MALPKRPTSLKSNAGNLSQVRQWTAIQVADWMKEANDGLFAPYTDNILQLKINGADLMNLTQTDMKTKLGITTPNHITTLSASIERLKKKSRRSKKHRNKSPASPYEDTQNSSKSKAGISFNDIPDLATNNNKRQSAILPTSKTSLTNQHSSSSSINGLNLTSLTSLNDDMQKQKKPGHVNKAKSMFIQSNGILNENGGDYEYVNLRNENTKNGNHKNGNNKNKKKNGNKMPANKLYRAYTVQIQKDNDDQKTKHDTAQLKRVLTEQNLANKKKDKYLYKDLGKKLVCYI